MPAIIPRGVQVIALLQFLTDDFLDMRVFRHKSMSGLNFCKPEIKLGADAVKSMRWLTEPRHGCPSVYPRTPTSMKDSVAARTSAIASGSSSSAHRDQCGNDYAYMVEAFCQKVLYVLTKLRVHQGRCNEALCAAGVCEG